jgi:hypothetical protein
MGANRFESKKIDRPAPWTKRQKHFYYAIPAHDASLRASEPTDSGLLHFWSAGSAGGKSQFISYAFLWTLPLQAIGLAEDKDLATGK